MTLALTPNEKSSVIYINTNRTNQSYTWFDAQVPNDHLFKSSLLLSKEANGTDVTHVSALTIELLTIALWPVWFLHTLTCHSVLCVRKWELLTPKYVLTIELEPTMCCIILIRIIIK